MVSEPVRSSANRNYSNNDFHGIGFAEWGRKTTFGQLAQPWAVLTPRPAWVCEYVWLSLAWAAVMPSSNSNAPRRLSNGVCPVSKMGFLNFSIIDIGAG